MSIGEILSSQTYVAGHVLLLNSIDRTNTGISYTFLTVKLWRKSTMKELHIYIHLPLCQVHNNYFTVNYCS